MIDKCGGEEFRDRLRVYVDAGAMDVGVVVRVEVGFRREDARDGDKGDDEDGMRDAGCSPLEVVLTSCYGAEGGTEDRDVDETP